MSLVVALANEQEIVLVGDTFCPAGDKNGHYGRNAKYSKILPVSNGLAVGIAGHIGAADFILKQTDPAASFSGVVDEHYDRIHEDYSKGKRHYHMSFLFCGFYDGKPKMSAISCSYFGGDPADGGVEQAPYPRAAIGLNEHGALQYLHSFHSSDMDTKRLILLGAFCVFECISQDERVSAPIEIVIVRPNTRPEILSPERSAEVREICKRKRAEVSMILTKHEDSFIFGDSDLSPLVSR